MLSSARSLLLLINVKVKDGLEVFPETYDNFLCKTLTSLFKISFVFRLDEKTIPEGQQFQRVVFGNIQALAGRSPDTKPVDKIHKIKCSSNKRPKGHVAPINSVFMARVIFFTKAFFHNKLCLENYSSETLCPRTKLPRWIKCSSEWILPSSSFSSLRKSSFSGGKFSTSNSRGLSRSSIGSRTISRMSFALHFGMTFPSSSSCAPLSSADYTNSRWS